MASSAVIQIMSGYTTQTWRDFAGELPLLCFPEVVLYPYAVRPIRLTEPATIEAVSAVHDTSRLVLTTIDSPQSGAMSPESWIGCLARISVCQPLSDGSMLVLLRGLGRGVIEERSPGGIFATARALPDRYPSPAAISRSLRRQELLEAFLNCASHKPLPATDAALSHQLSLGCLCDVLAQAIDLPNVPALELLQAVNVDVRSDVLLDALRSLHRTERDFPPRFSSN